MINFDKFDARKNEKLLSSLKEKDDINIRNELILNNIKLVSDIASRYSGSTLSLTYEDLMQEGILGLSRAIERYDASFNAAFATYACRCIEYTIMQAVQEKDRMIYLPKKPFWTVKKYLQLRNLGKNKEECSRELGMPISEIDIIVNAFYPPKSLDEQVEDEREKLSDHILDENAKVSLKICISDETKKEINKLINSDLSERELYVIKHRFGFDNYDPATLEDIGKELNVSRERVRQIEVMALRKLRHSEYIRNYKEDGIDDLDIELEIE